MIVDALRDPNQVQGTGRKAPSDEPQRPGPRGPLLQSRQETIGFPHVPGRREMGGARKSSEHQEGRGLSRLRALVHRREGRHVLERGSPWSAGRSQRSAEAEPGAEERQEYDHAQVKRSPSGGGTDEEIHGGARGGT